MNNIPNITLNDTYTLLQLMRETALVKGRQAQADKLNPVMEEMRSLVQSAKKSEPLTTAETSAAGGILGQEDFQHLLQISQQRQAATTPPKPASDPMERNRMINAMASAEMSEVDIARQMGMTREEVRLVLCVQQRSNTPNGGGWIR
ncbi:MAG: hypothetical protein AB1453_03425 [Chloroflexota bacterium]|jgi:transcriptional regulator with GAF, ATPase, and Fis domain